MDSQDMRKRTKKFAVRVMKLVPQLPRSDVGFVIGRQLVKSATSIGANYAEASRASSRRHFVSVVEIATREAIETEYWLELLLEAELFTEAQLGSLLKECGELCAILTSMGKLPNTE